MFQLWVRCNVILWLPKRGRRHKLNGLIQLKSARQCNEWQWSIKMVYVDAHWSRCLLPYIKVSMVMFFRVLENILDWCLQIDVIFNLSLGSTQRNQSIFPCSLMNWGNVYIAEQLHPFNTRHFTLYTFMSLFFCPIDIVVGNNDISCLG